MLGIHSAEKQRNLEGIMNHEVSFWIAVLALLVSLAILIWQVITWYMDRRGSILVIQQGSDITNLIFHLPGDMTGITLDVAVINNSHRSNVIIRHYDLELPWNDPQFDWLPDPKGVQKDNAYTFAGGWPSYPRDRVLNHRTYAQGTLEPGDVVQGVLVGCGPASIPDDIRGRDDVAMTLAVYDQNGKRHSSRFLFRVGR